MDSYECYICAGTEGPLLLDVCKCTGRCIHPTCQANLVRRLEKDGRCRVCRDAYRNLRVTSVRSRNLKRLFLTMVFGMILGSEFVAVSLITVHAIVYFLYSGVTVDVCQTVASTHPPIHYKDRTAHDDEKTLLCVTITRFVHMGFCTQMCILFELLAVLIAAHMGVRSLINRLPPSHERQEIHFLSYDAFGTPKPGSASADAAYAEIAESLEPAP